MNTETSRTIFTIGHSNMESGKFVALLNEHGIRAVADVRTSSYSKYIPHFNREPLRCELREHGIYFIVIASNERVELGARIDAACHINNDEIGAKTEGAI